MDINHIKLPAFVITGLYPDSIVDVPVNAGDQLIKPAPQPTVHINKQSVGATYQSIGGNLRNILIMVNYPGISFLPDDDLKFLTGVLGACKLSLADVAIVNKSNYPLATFKELGSFFKSKIVFLFDISPLDFGMPMDFPHYQIQPFAGNSFLYATSLKNLAEDKPEKTKLWVSLKRLFNL